MQSLFSILFTLFTFTAIAGSNLDLNSNEIEALKDTEMMLFEGQGYEVVQTLTAEGNYYCKKKNNKWIRCSKITGQCFGEPMEQKFQCENALPSGNTAKSNKNGDKYCVKNKSNKYVTCSKSTGQCYGSPMDTKAQCENSWGGGKANTPNADHYCTEKNFKYQKCSVSTGQCFGGLFEKYAQCQNAL